MNEIYSQEFFLTDDMHSLSLNKFADWTDEEYQQLLGFHPNMS